MGVSTTILLILLELTGLEVLGLPWSKGRPVLLELEEREESFDNDSEDTFVEVVEDDEFEEKAEVLDLEDSSSDLFSWFKGSVFVSSCRGTGIGFKVDLRIASGLGPRTEWDFDGPATATGFEEVARTATGLDAVVDPRTATESEDRSESLMIGKDPERPPYTDAETSVIARAVDGEILAILEGVLDFLSVWVTLWLKNFLKKMFKKIIFAFAAKIQNFTFLDRKIRLNRSILLQKRFQLNTVVSHFLY